MHNFFKTTASTQSLVGYLRGEWLECPAGL